MKGKPLGDNDISFLLAEIGAKASRAIVLLTIEAASKWIDIVDVGA